VNRVILGDCIEVLKTLDAGSVQCCVTSPPYYGLRDYGTAQWEGGDPGCDHDPARPDGGERANRTLPLGRGGIYKDTCRMCGAVRVDEQIGLEETPEAFVEKLVDVFREVRRVLADDGTIWVNLGDSYAGSSKGQGGVLNSPKQRSNKGSYFGAPLAGRVDGLKNKDLIGIPWMVAFALRADGWYLRSDIIWHKPNPMPESVTDRPTKSHEYIFLLSKSAQYYYDAEAIAEAGSNNSHGGTLQKFINNNDRKIKSTQERTANSTLGGTAAEYGGTRNKRDVWTVTTKPYSGAHFATFPPDLIEPCILAGSREGDTVLDPFNGSGTTGAVSIKHHRNYIGIELNPAYVELTNKRFASVQPVLFPQVSP
jgi:DNA modification methylase